MQSRGWDVRLTREPGGTPIGARVRALLLDPDSKGLDPCAELLLYMADRVQHVNTLVKPALKDGAAVLCDRYFDATVVYQGAGRGIQKNLIMEIYRLLLGSFKPDLTFLFDLPPDIGLIRAWKAVKSGGRNLQETRFETEALAFHEAIRAGYLSLARKESDRFRIIDANQPVEKVWDDVRSHFDRIGTPL